MFILNKFIKSRNMFFRLMDSSYQGKEGCTGRSGRVGLADVSHYIHVEKQQGLPA